MANLQMSRTVEVVHACQLHFTHKFFVIPLTSKNVNLKATTDFQIDSTDPAIAV